MEFAHPVIVGKRALLALDLSVLFGPWLQAILRPEDIVMGFGPPQGDPELPAALRHARAAGAWTVALPGTEGDYCCEAATADPFNHQEVIEVLYHTLWETVHVFLERREQGLDTGEAGFLYPFLGQQKQDTADLIPEVARSILMKAADDARLRERMAAESSDEISYASAAIAARLARGERRGNRFDLSAPAHRSGAARRRGYRNLHQRRLAQHRHGARRGAQAQAAHRGVARL